MNPNDPRLHALIDYYQEQGAPSDQQMLASLLHDVQELYAGTLPFESLSVITESYHLKPSILHAMIRRIPTLHYENAPNTLEICKTCRQSGELAKQIESIYHVKDGAISVEGHFSYRVTGCMKNCRRGPSVRWNGNLIHQASIERIRQLISSGLTQDDAR